MPMIEVDETELSNLRRLESVAKRVSLHPKGRGLMQEAVALALPEEVGPETAIRREFSEQFASLRDELKADREARQKREEEAEAARNLAKLQNQWNETRGQARAAGYTDEGLTALESWMETKGVADHTIAIPAFERENPPPEPLMTGGSKWNFFDQTAKEDVSLKPLFDGNEDAFMGPAIQRALSEARGR